MTAYRGAEPAEGTKTPPPALRRHPVSTWDPPIYRRAVAQRLAREEARSLQGDPAPQPVPSTGSWWQRVVLMSGLAACVALVWFVLVWLRTAPVASGDELVSRLDEAVADSLLADRALAVLVWVGNVSTTFVLGGIVFRLFVAGPGLARAEGCSAGADNGKAVRCLRTAALVGLLASVVSVVPRAMAIAGSDRRGSSATDWGVWHDPATLRFVVESSFGDAACLRIAGLAVLLGLALDAAGPQRHLRSRGACLLGGLLILASYATVGHPQATQPAALLVLAQCVHIVAVATWFGGVAFLAIELRRLRRTGSAEDLAGVVRRFSAVATVSVVLAGTTGSLLALSQVPSARALLATGYGRALLGKLSCVVVLLGLGGYNHRRLVPALGRAPDTATAWRRLQHTAVVETVCIALGVLLFTTAMTTGGL